MLAGMLIGAVMPLAFKRGEDSPVRQSRPCAVDHCLAGLPSILSAISSRDKLRE
jgi:hypothetical protein